LDAQARILLQPALKKMSARTDALSQDVELALQAAIGQANNPYGDLSRVPHDPNGFHGGESGKKRKSRKSGEGDEGQRKRKKKSKDLNEFHDLGALSATPMVQTQESMAPSPGLALDPSSVPPVKKKDKKRKEKGKGKERSKSKEKGKEKETHFQDSVQSQHEHPATSTMPNIDPALQNIRSTLPTEELVAALQRASANDMHAHGHLDHSGSSLGIPPLQDLVGEAGGDASEELLRILQELDLPKIAGFLKSFSNLGDGTMNVPFPGTGIGIPSSSGIPNMHIQDPSQDHHPLAVHSQQHQPPHHSQPHQPVNQVRPPGFNAPKRPPPRQVTQPIEAENHDHAYTLANRWLGSAKLAEMAKKEGLVYKKGKFSALEDDLLAKAIEHYRMSRYLSQDDILAMIRRDPGTKDKSDSFWFEITAQVPLRPVMAVYHHVRRIYDSKGHQGKWIPEEDVVLERAVSELGQRWEKVSHQVGRTANDCRDRWRNHIQHRSTRIAGPWSKEEEDQLTAIVLSITTDKGISADNDVFWSEVSNKMGNRRTRQQCRIKWYDALNKTHKNRGDKPRWSLQDAYILVCKLASLNINDDTEIDWKLLNDEDWNLWSAHQLQRRFQTLKKSVKGYETMTFHEILDILKEKKAGAPPQAQKKPMQKKNHISREYVSDDDAAEDIPQPEEPLAT